MAKQIADNSSSSFGANIEKNPKEECKAIMTRSRKATLVKDKGRTGDGKQQQVSEDEGDQLKEKSINEKEKEVEEKNDGEKEINEEEKEKEKEKEINEKNREKEENRKTKSELAREKKKEVVPCSGRELSYPLV